MTRFFKRLVFTLVTLGLGALAYALLRTEGERVLRSVTPAPSDEPPPEPEAEKPRKRPAPAVRTEPAPSPPAGRTHAAAAGSRGGAAEPRTCVGKTKAGKPCSRPAQPGSSYCWQHA